MYHIINVKVQPYFFTALPGLWLGLKYQSLCYHGVEWSLLGAIGIHCAYYFTYIPYNYQ